MNEVLGALSSHLHSIKHLAGQNCSGQLHYSLHEDGIHSAVLRGDCDGVDQLLSPKTINLPLPEDRATPLHVACAVGSHHIARKLLQSGCFLHPVDKDGATPLHIASQFGHQGIVSELLSAGADPTAKDKYGQTPYFLAHRVKHKAVLKILHHAQRGKHEDRQDQRFSVFSASFARSQPPSSTGIPSVANSRPALTPMNSDPASPWMMSAVNSAQSEDLCNTWVAIPCSSDRSEWLAAVKEADTDKIRSMCSTFGKSVLETEDTMGRTALHRAVGVGQVKVAELCLSLGAVVDSVDQAGRTPLHWAALSGREDMVSLLLVHQANVNARDEEEVTPLHYAAANPCQGVVKRLVEAGAGVAAMDKEGRTPFMWAQDRGNNGLLHLLRLETGNLRARVCRKQTQAANGSDGRGASLRRTTSFTIEPPLLYICPITQDIMIDPVVAADGNTYERKAIEEWFRRTNRSPMTNEQVVDTLIPNRVLRSSIMDWMDSNTKH